MKKLMQKLAPVTFAVLMLAAAASFLPGPAEAAPKFKATLSTSPRFTCFSGPNFVARIQSMEGVPYCFKTSTDGGAATCTQDFKPLENPVVGTLFDGGAVGTTYLTSVATTSGQGLTFGPFPMGADTCISAKSLDGGDPRVNVFYETANGP